MSRLYYFASDCALEEQANPYVKMLSINQALEMGIEIDLNLFEDDFNKDDPSVVLYCENENDFGYPTIFHIKKENYYDDIGTSKQFCTALQWEYEDHTVEVIIKYIQNHLMTASELELWSVWLGNHVKPEAVKKMRCNVNNLTVGMLKEFYTSMIDVQCLTVVK